MLCLSPSGRLVFAGWPCNNKECIKECRQCIKECRLCSKDFSKEAKEEAKEESGGFSKEVKSG
jgi:hypothetical protein